LVRLSLLAASESSGVPSLQLDVSLGESPILTHVISLQPSQNKANDAPKLNESNGHPGNKKRKQPEGEEKEAITVVSADSLDFPMFHSQEDRSSATSANPLRHSKKKHKIAVQSKADEENNLARLEGLSKRNEDVAMIELRHPCSTLSAQQRSRYTFESEEVSVPGILSLPVELLQYIFLHVPVRQMARLNEVCKQWEAVVDDEILWRHIFNRQFGIPLMFRLSWKQRALACSRRAQIYELDLEGLSMGNCPGLPSLDITNISKIRWTSIQTTPRHT